MSDINYALTEQFYIACILEKPNLLMSSDNIGFSKIGRNIIKTINNLKKDKKNVTLGNIVLEASKFDSDITIDKLKDLSELDKDLDSFDKYQEDLKRILLIEELRMKEVKELVLNIESSNVGNNLLNIQESAYSVLQKVRKLYGKKETVLSLPEMYDTFSEELLKRTSSKHSSSSGDLFLDGVLGNGLPPGELALIYARPSMGKSAYALHLINSMINLRLPVIYINLEMSAIATAQRLISMRTGIPHQFFYNSEKELDVYEEQVGIIETEKNKLKSTKHFWLVDDPYVDLAKIEQYVTDFRMRTGFEKVTVVVDLLSMVQDMKGSNSNRAVSIEDGLDNLSASIKDLNCSFLGIVQANRSSEGDSKITDEQHVSKMRPELKHLKNSGAWEERARIVLGLFRPKYYYEKYLPELDHTQQNIIEVQVLKNSNGSTGQVLKYLFHETTFKISKYEDEYTNLEEDSAEEEY